MMKYLLVEGVTDVAFIKYICFKNNITKNFDDFEKINNEYRYNDVVIVDLKGQENLSKFLIRLNEKIVKVSQIFIIQDADNDFEKSITSIKNAIVKSTIDKNKIKYFLTPNDKELGDLETMLLSTIQDNNIVKCFEPYKKCLQSNNEIYEKALNKGQVYAYTMYSQSGKDLHKPQDSFMYKFEGKYIDTNLWDLSKPEFEPIISFVEDIFKD
jgi:hypothetical protein